MKKILSMLLATMLVFTLVACGNGNQKGAADETTVEILKKVWEAYPEEGKFPVGGGTPDAVIMDEPGSVNVNDAEALDSILGFPQASIALLEDAASLMHMMNVNTFTAGAYRISEPDETEMLIADMQDNIMNRQWICGFPDTLIIVQIGEDVLISAFGNAEAIETFKTTIQDVYKGAEVVCEESLI